jgi:hypothetical protein
MKRGRPATRPLPSRKFVDGQERCDSQKNWKATVSRDFDGIGMNSSRHCEYQNLENLVVLQVNSTVEVTQAARNVCRWERKVKQCLIADISGPEVKAALVRTIERKGATMRVPE